MNRLVEAITPGVSYEKGFKINGKILPFYSFCRPEGENGWSDQMSVGLEEFSRNHFIDRYNRKIVLDNLQDILSRPGCAYLDAGCSSGYMLEDVLSRVPGVDAAGADYFTAGLLKCHQSLPDVPLFQFDLLDCRFPDGLFDAVTCLNVLEHIQDDARALRQLARIIKPGGRLAATVPMGPHLYDIYDEAHYHVRRYELKAFKDKIISAGFKVLRFNYFGALLYPAFYMVKKLNRVRYRGITGEEKKRIVFKQIAQSARSPFMEKLCSWEESWGRYVRYPFGIRGYVVAQKG